MVDIEQLKQEEIITLNNEELNLEDLILLGEDKKIPITIEFPKPNGDIVKAKALVKQLTLKELDNLKLKSNKVVDLNVILLKKGLFKQKGDRFTEEEIKSLPIGVVNAIAEKIMDLSGIDEKQNNELLDF